MVADLAVLDVVLLVASILLSVLIGLFFTFKNNSIDSYLLGDRKLSLIPVAISLMTSCTSGLSLLGSSAELYYQGLSFAFVVLAILLSGPITAYTILPVFYHLNELSLYKYLHLRYGLVIKYIVTVMFILQMIFYNAVVLYLPSMALQSILQVPRFYSILIVGLLSVLYSAIGGLKAVVWTDFFQAILMYGSILTVGLVGTWEAGGFGQLVANAHAGGRLNLDGFLNIDLTTRHTLMPGILIGYTVKEVYSLGVNQVQIQRALSLNTLRQAQLSFVLCSVFTALMSLLASFMGLVIYSNYGSCDPYLAGEIPRRDAIIVHFVAHRLAAIPGLRGLFVAGIFSATLSTLSSFANSMAALALQDFVKPLMALRNASSQTGEPNEQQLSDATSTKLAKLLATCFGLACVGTAYLIDKANSRLLQTSTTLFGAIGVPFLGAFALGIFTRFANTKGILAGFAVTLSLGIYVMVMQIFFSPPLEPSQSVYYDAEQCAQVFDGNRTAALMRPQVTTIEESLDVDYAEPVGISISQISYMTLPALQFFLMLLISSVVSLLTGGLSQQVPDVQLVSLLHKERLKEKNLRRGQQVLNVQQTPKRKLAVVSNDHHCQVTEENKQVVR